MRCFEEDRLPRWPFIIAVALLAASAIATVAVVGGGRQSGNVRPIDVDLPGEPSQKARPRRGDTPPRERSHGRTPFRPVPAVPEEPPPDDADRAPRSPSPPQPPTPAPPPTGADDDDDSTDGDDDDDDGDDEDD